MDADSLVMIQPAHATTAARFLLALSTCFYQINNHSFYDDFLFTLLQFYVNE